MKAPDCQPSKTLSRSENKISTALQAPSPESLAKSVGNFLDDPAERVVQWAPKILVVVPVDKMFLSDHNLPGPVNNETPTPIIPEPIPMMSNRNSS